MLLNQNPIQISYPKKAMSDPDDIRKVSFNRSINYEQLRSDQKKDEDSYLDIDSPII